MYSTTRGASGREREKEREGAREDEGKGGSERERREIHSRNETRVDNQTEDGDGASMKMIGK